MYAVPDCSLSCAPKSSVESDSFPNSVGLKYKEKDCSFAKARTFLLFDLWDFFFRFTVEGLNNFFFLRGGGGGGGGLGGGLESFSEIFFLFFFFSC